MMTWDDADDVGVAEFDMQHRRIFQVLADLKAHPEARADSEFIADALDRLTRFGDAHFRAEETLLRDLGYAHLQEQLDGHRRFRRVVAELCCATATGDPTVPARLESFVEAWWEDHVRGADRRYAAFLGARNRA